MTATGLAVPDVPVVESPRTELAPVAPNRVISIAELLHFAIERQLPAAELKEFVALHERVADRAAAQEFAVAIAAFQRECPPIKRTATAKIVTKNGGTYSYTYAPLDDIARHIAPFLAKHGLSYSYNSSVAGPMLTCACTVRHVNGHAVTSEFTLPTENKSAMSPQQMVGAALTFAQRRSLSLALGLTITDDDDPDSQKQVDPTPITDDQLTQLEDLIAESKVNRAKFLAYLGVDDLKNLPAVNYAEAVTALEEKKKRAAR